MKNFKCGDIITFNLMSMDNSERFRLVVEDEYPNGRFKFKYLIPNYSETKSFWNESCNYTLYSTIFRGEIDV